MNVSNSCACTANRTKNVILNFEQLSLIMHIAHTRSFTNLMQSMHIVTLHLAQGEHYRCGY